MLWDIPRRRFPHSLATKESSKDDNNTFSEALDRTCENKNKKTILCPCERSVFFYHGHTCHLGMGDAYELLDFAPVGSWFMIPPSKPHGGYCYVVTGHFLRDKWEDPTLWAILENKAGYPDRPDVPREERHHDFTHATIHHLANRELFLPVLMYTEDV